MLTSGAAKCPPGETGVSSVLLTTTMQSCSEELPDRPAESVGTCSASQADTPAGDLLLPGHGDSA
jgi:hypothetical protein